MSLAKPILKLFDYLIAYHSSFLTIRTDAQFKWEPRQWRRKKYTRGAKILRF